MVYMSCIVIAIYFQVSDFESLGTKANDFADKLAAQVGVHMNSGSCFYVYMLVIRACFY